MIRKPQSCCDFEAGLTQFLMDLDERAREFAVFLYGDRVKGMSLDQIVKYIRLCRNRPRK